MHMANLQVRNLPEALHAELAERARRKGVSMSDYVTRLLRADFAHPPIETWIEWVREQEPREQVDVTGLIDEVRGEYDAQGAHDARGSSAGAQQ